MRIRTAVAAAVGALALLASVPGSASAAEGEFGYQYVDANGQVQAASLQDPASEGCITLPETADESAPPANSAHNETNATATIFTGADCEGEYYTVEPGASTDEDRDLRSVVFS